MERIQLLVVHAGGERLVSVLDGVDWDHVTIEVIVLTAPPPVRGPCECQCYPCRSRHV
jgi:hypothetical protein